jgi:prepilin signal peptidase PulO-like enzyme (type II secretory pathway)
MISLFIFLFGLAIGSFLNCVIYRMECRDKISPSSKKGEATSPLRGRSFCPHCKHLLSWQDLIPVFSFFILGGKCRYCGKRISWQYPLVELSTGILFLLIFIYFNNLLVTGYWLPVTIFWLLVTSFLIIIFVYDLKHYIIPDKVIYPAILLTLVFRICLPTGDLPKGENLEFGILLNYLLSAFLAAGFFLFIVLISRGKWMGAGDIKLAFLIGLLLGWPNVLLALFLAFLIGAIIGLGLIILKKKTIKSELPFGPFLILGIYIALFFGEKMINWYLSLFLI